MLEFFKSGSDNIKFSHPRPLLKLMKVYRAAMWMSMHAPRVGNPKGLSRFEDDAVDTTQKEMKAVDRQVGRCAPPVVLIRLLVFDHTVVFVLV